MPDAEKIRAEWPEGLEMTMELIRRHPELFQKVPPLDQILFVYDKGTAPMSRGNEVFARVSKIPDKFTEFVIDGDKRWMLEWFHWPTERLTPNKKTVLLAHELLHFDRVDGATKLRGHDFEEFFVIADRFGTRWTDYNSPDVENIFASSFRWGFEGQSSLLGQVLGDVAEQINAGALDMDGTRVTAKVVNMNRTAAERK